MGRNIRGTPLNAATRVLVRPLTNDRHVRAIRLSTTLLQSADRSGIQIPQFVGHVGVCLRVQMRSPMLAKCCGRYAGVIPNLFRKEWPHTTPGEQWEMEVIAPQLKLSNGYVEVPSEPGLGAIVDIEYLRKQSRLI